MSQPTRSTSDYNAWKEETRLHYYARFPNKKQKIDGFIDYLSLLHDKHQRAFLPREVIFYLWGKRNWAIKNNQHFWVALIGKKGGEGKSTLADYFSMIFDPTYNKDRSQQDYTKWLAAIVQAKKETPYPAVVLDEPDNKTHELSVKGRERKDILERIRILKLFVCVCANSLSSVPPSIYERLGAIVYINNQHRFWLWDSSKDRPKETVIEDIKGKDGWGKYRHAVFKRPEFVARAYIKHEQFSPPDYSPFKSENYEKRKEEDVLSLIDSQLGKEQAKAALAPTTKLKSHSELLAEQIYRIKMRKPNLTNTQIGYRLGIGARQVLKLKKEFVLLPSALGNQPTKV